MIHLYENGVNVFIKRFKSNKNEAFWDNYDLVIWNKNDNGFFSKKGLYRNSWGVADKLSVTKEGTWVLPKTYVKHFK